MADIKVDGVAGSQGVTVPGAADSIATSSPGLDKDAFLKLLVAQLKYQDPTKPMDSSQYMSQMAQFTSVEKLANLEKSQAEISSWQRAIAGEGMVGKHVSATNDKGATVAGDVVGLQLTSKGPTLMLQGGATVLVDQVNSVTPIAVTGTTAPSGTSTSSGSTESTGSTGSSGTTGTTGTTGSTGSTDSTGSGQTAHIMRQHSASATAPSAVSEDPLSEASITAMAQSTVYSWNAADIIRGGSGSLTLADVTATLSNNGTGATTVLGAAKTLDVVTRPGAPGEHRSTGFGLTLENGTPIGRTTYSSLADAIRDNLRNLGLGQTDYLSALDNISSRMPELGAELNAEWLSAEISSSNIGNGMGVDLSGLTREDVLLYENAMRSGGDLSSLMGKGSATLDAIASFNPNQPSDFANPLSNARELLESGATYTETGGIRLPNGTVLTSDSHGYYRTPA